MAKSKVLLVDDDLMILAALRRILRKEEYHLYTANDVDQALDILEEQDIRLIISDYRMPGRSGDQLLREVKAKYPHVRRVMLTGLANLEEAKQIVNDETAEILLTKPWIDDELRTQIKEALLVTD